MTTTTISTYPEAVASVAGIIRAATDGSDAAWSLHRELNALDSLVGDWLIGDDEQTAMHDLIDAAREAILNLS